MHRKNCIYVLYARARVCVFCLTLSYHREAGDTARDERGRQSDYFSIWFNETTNLMYLFTYFMFVHVDEWGVWWTRRRTDNTTYYFL